MIPLARKLRLTDYFTLAFGTMVGVGWLVVMDDWLGRGGPLGAIWGFAIGGVALLPIGYVYGRLVVAMPDASGEVAYTAKVFPAPVSFATGWMMLLAYFIVCPWEAVAVGKIVAYIFPALDSWELYRLGGQPVFLPHVVIGLGLTAFLTALNYRGIRLSATFQNWTTFGVLALFVGIVSCGAASGSVENFPPLFSRGRLVSILLVIQIVPYFMTGFESVAKCAEEASPEFRSRDYFRAIALAIGVGILFYTLVIGAVAYVSPWAKLTTEKFATAVAFERGLRSPWIVHVILATALLSLLKVFNGNFVASSRLLFALGRRGLVDSRLARVHPVNRTPSAAALWVGLAAAASMFLGDAILIPVTEVGSVACAFGWLASCAAFCLMRPGIRDLAISVAGVLVGLLLVLIKVLPFVPGHFSAYEYLALGAWGLIGLVLNWRASTSKEQRGGHV